jgi:hypothetical protein
MPAFSREICGPEAEFDEKETANRGENGSDKIRRLVARDRSRLCSPHQPFGPPISHGLQEQASGESIRGQCRSVGRPGRGHRAFVWPSSLASLHEDDVCMDFNASARHSLPSFSMWREFFPSSAPCRMAGTEIHGLGAAGRASNCSAGTPCCIAVLSLVFAPAAASPGGRCRTIISSIKLTKDPELQTLPAEYLLASNGPHVFDSHKPS